MKNKIESRYGNRSGDSSSSGSSTEIKRESSCKDREEFHSRLKHKKHHSERREFNRKRKSSPESSSNSDSDSDEESTSKRIKHSYKKDKSLKVESGYDRVKIKEEPITDDERNRRRSRSRSRSINNDRSPIKQERFGDGSNVRIPIKKERTRFSDIEKEPCWGKQTDEQTTGQEKKKPMVNKAKPDFGLSGKLAEETNTYNGVVIKYSEPPEARKPKRRWRLYPFKGDEGLPTLYIHRQSAFLIGRDRKVADLPIDHPSCSKQHAVLQYRLVPFERSDGTKGKRICPYIIDLESANGTFVNNNKIEPRKYVQLLEKDVIKFAFSSREYVLLHEHSKDSEDDDNM